MVTARTGQSREAFLLLEYAPSRTSAKVGRLCHLTQLTPSLLPISGEWAAPNSQ
jgi:hypothetical protein